MLLRDVGMIYRMNECSFVQYHGFHGAVNLALCVVRALSRCPCDGSGMLVTFESSFI